MSFTTSSKQTLASNGLTKVGAYVHLGGVVTGNTDIALNSNNFSITKNSSQLSFLRNNGFIKELGFNNTVNKVIVQSGDSKILVAGFFTSYNGIAVNKIVRLNSDFTLDTSFLAPSLFSNTNITNILLQPDGKIIVAGGLITGFASSNSFYRLNADGTIDTTFSSGSGAGNIMSMTLQPDGKIIATGNFTSYRGITANRIVRINADGTYDSTFVTGTGFPANPNGLGTKTIVLQPDGKIVVVGGFTSYNGTSINRIVRLNSTGGTDSTFNVGTGFNNIPHGIEIQPDGKFIVVGQFTSYKGVTANRIIRINTTGGTDTSFVTGTGFNASNVVGISLNSDSTMIITGAFTAYNGQNIGTVIKLNSTGGTITSFNNVNTNSAGPFLIDRQPDGKYVLGYQFNPTIYNGVGFNGILRLNSTGSVDTSVTQNYAVGGFDSSVFDIIQQTDGKFVVGGQFFTHGGYAYRGIVRIDISGNTDTSFATLNGLNNQVNSVALQTNGKILAGGSFTTFTGTSQNRLIRFNTNGSKDSIFNIGTGFNNTVNKVFIQNDGKIVVGGNFTTYTGTTYNRIIRLNTDGTVDSSFSSGTGFDAAVLTMVQQSDGKLLMGGSFTTYNGVIVNRIVRLNTNGTIDNTFNNVLGFGFNSQKYIGGGFDGTVQTIKLQPDGRILVGGNIFKNYNGITANGIIRLYPDGSIDTGFQFGTGLFSAIIGGFAVSSDGRILVAGSFTQNYNGISISNSMIRLTSTGDLDPTFSTVNYFSAINVILPYTQNGKNCFLLGGGFTTNSSPVLLNYFSSINEDGSLNITPNDNIKIVNAPIFYGGDYSSQMDGRALVNKDVVMNLIGNIKNGITKSQTTNATTLGGILIQNTTVNDDNVNFNLTLKSKTTTIGSGLNTLALSSSFLIGTGFDNAVLNMATQSDGKLLLLGTFTSYNNITASRIISLNTDGTIDSGTPSFIWGSGFDAQASTAAVQTDGKIVIGGFFSKYRTSTAARIVRVNTTGATDTTFVTGAGFAGTNANIAALAIQSDGKIIAGGQFSTYSGASYNNIIRLNTNGSIDSSFVIGTGFTVNTLVNAITIQTGDSKILLGGTFTTYSGSSSNKLIRLNTNGSKDSTFNIGSGFNVLPTNTAVNSIVVQPNGKILVGGTFTTFTGSTNNRLIRLNSDGSKDSTFNVGTGFNNPVVTITLQSDGKMLITGTFTSFNGTAVNQIIKLNSDGSRDITFVPGTGINSIGSSVNAVKLQSDGKFILGGFLTQYNGISVSKILRINSNGSIDGGTSSLANSMLTYNFDYSSNYTPRTVPDWGAVTGQTSTSVAASKLAAIVLVSGSTTLVTTTDLALVATTGGTFTVTLPASPSNGYTVVVKDDSNNAFTNNITVNGNGHNIDGLATFNINTNYGGAKFTYSSARNKWYVTAFVS